MKRKLSIAILGTSLAIGTFMGSIPAANAAVPTAQAANTNPAVQNQYGPIIFGDWGSCNATGWYFTDFIGGWKDYSCFPGAQGWYLFWDYNTAS